MSAEETVNVNMDGTTTPDEPTSATGDEVPTPLPQETPPVPAPTAEEDFDFKPPTLNPEGMGSTEEAAGVDPAVFVILAVAVIVGLWFFLFSRRKENNDDDYFQNLDGEKFNLKLPAEVEEYYNIREKCEAAGWEPGKGPPKGAENPSAVAGPHRVMAQALMKRAIADIPIVTHIQKESPGMNKLYSQSMCSVNQWKAYQAAESLVSAEVEEVRAEADDIEPGWSQVVWRQAMQYHNVLKQKHEMETKAAEEQAKKRREVEQRVQAARQEQNNEEDKKKAAEKAAEELIKQEEREKQGKKAFSGSGMKKGFLDNNKKGKKK